MMRNYKLSVFPEPVQLLHIRCGDDILGTLEQAGVPGDRVRWVDVLSEGPLRQPTDAGRRQRERAAYLAARFRVGFPETLRELQGQDWRITQCVRYDETVLWFEADLFDQLVLVYLLQALAPFRAATRLSLVCIGEFPGVERFIGLGQLSAEQLVSLLPQRVPVTARQLSLAAEVWRALNHWHPRELVRISRQRLRALPFLPAALCRLLAEYPSTRNGLSQTEQHALAALAAGARTPAQAFQAMQAREPRPFMGDSMFYAVLRDLASGTYPLVGGSRRNFAKLPDVQLAACEIWLTAMGERLLANQGDWFELREPARWIGGVLVRGPNPRWRWDPDRGRLVEQRGRPHRPVRRRLR